MSATVAGQALDVAIDRVDVSAYTIPTDEPESDGTLGWDSTIVVVEIDAGGRTGLGYTYADASVAALVRSKLAPELRNTPLQGWWTRLGAALRNAGRPGAGWMALSAVDVALWDSARACSTALLPPERDEVPIYGSGGFTSYSLDRLGDQLAGWVDAGIPRVKMKIGREPSRDPVRLDAAREAIGFDCQLYVDANGAYSPKQALAWAERLAEEWGVTWLEEPVTSQPDRLRRLPTGRRHALRRDHRRAEGRRAGGGVPAGDLGPLCPGDLGARPVRRRNGTKSGVVPRPCPRRVAPLRRRARAGRRLAQTRSLAARPRPRAEARGRGALRRMTETVPAKTRPAYRTPPRAGVRLDRARLERELRGQLEGEVRFSPGDRALYASGGSNYRQVPIGVVIPKTVEDVVAAVAVCREHGAPVLSRGGGTSLAGQVANVAVVLDFSKYLNRVLDVDPARRRARVEPGLILDHLRAATERHGLTYGPDPSTHDHCTLGGMIGNNSCGTHSVMAEFHGPGPLTADQVLELEVLTYRGERLRVGRGPEGLPDELRRRLADLRDRYGDRVRDRYPDIPRRVSGYNLDRLLPEQGFDVAGALVGTESTCVTVLEATVELIESPPVRSLVVLGYEDAATAGDHVPAVREHRPLAIEGVDETLLRDTQLVGLHREDVSLLPEGGGFLLVEFGGESKEEADEQANALLADARKHSGLKGTKLYDDPQAEQHLWEVREAGLGATAFIPGKPDTYEGWEDSAVPPERVGEYLRALGKLASRYGYESALYGHYGQGCIHARWNFDLVTRDGIRTFRRFLDDASDLVLSLGGSLSGEHGDGQSRAELLPKMFGEDLVEGFREFKSIWDPDWKMNPGKVVDPYPITESLRLGTSYNPPHVRAHFAYPNDGGSFAHATTRCVGIGKCRRTEGGVMCPSFMVTREEKHTTRGRARILWEMLNGGELELWRDDEVFESLDLCLSCKGCTHDCPVSVDLPTLKAEFLAHYYRGRLRPRHAYAFGLIDQAARVASRAPGLVNFVTRTPGLSALAKHAAGLAPERAFPAFAPLTLRDWFRTRRPRTEGRKVVLWPDTFSNYLHTDVGVAAVEALEAAGCRVSLPMRHLCCGRPLYDFGMLRPAHRYLLRVLDALRPEIRAGTPLVGVEPSCVAVFKDELPNLLADDEDAKRLAGQTFHLSEFLADHDWEPPRHTGRALVHGHCHHKATGGIGPETELLRRLGLEVEETAATCCGMAGSWGFEAEHHDLSLRIAEHGVLPKVRAAPTDTLLVADGFSCRTQLEQAGVTRPVLHVAQVLKLASEGLRPEDVVHRPQAPLARRAARGAVLAGAAAATVLAARR
jgi:FAD/FMN-containing dehydrogenase/Fe-S oxidoreductase